MVKFDSEEYWQKTTWDRHVELQRVPIQVRKEFENQEDLTVDAICQLIPLHQQLSILDVPCGTGRISESILKRCTVPIWLTLADFNSVTISLAKKYLNGYSSVNFRELDIYDISKEFHHEFDVVVCMDFFHHSSNLMLLLEQVTSVLKPGGILIGNVFAEEHYRKWDNLKYGLIKSTRRFTLYKIATRVYDFAPPYIKRIIRSQGFARIAPLTYNELTSSLESHFESFEIVEGYYYWFSAKTNKT